MKTMSTEMKDYLARGMREELQKDTIDYEDIHVRWHKGMRHETTNTIKMWMDCVKQEKEKDADFHFTVLEDAFEWWKNYFDVSPQFARDMEEKKKRELAEAYLEKKSHQEQDTLSAFEKL